MTTKKLQVNDRVKRVSGTGCLGVVREVKTEVTAVKPEEQEKGIMIAVAWDNGTVSYFSPGALQVVKE